MFTNKSFFKTLLGSLALVLASSFVAARAGDAYDNPQYREDYERYQKISAVKEAVPRGEQLVKFLMDRPDMNRRIWQSARQLLIEDMKRLEMREKWIDLRVLAERAIKLKPVPEDAYLFYGFALKGEKKMPEALNAFAKAYLLFPADKKREARKELDSLYRETHKNSIEGEDDVINAARKELTAAEQADALAKKKAKQ
jgi:hypothetical protein